MFFISILLLKFSFIGSNGSPNSSITFPQSSKIAIFLFGDFLNTLPTICLYKIWLFVGLAIIAKSVSGTSNPVVSFNTETKTLI